MRIKAKSGQQRNPLWPEELQVDQVVGISNDLFDSLMMQPLDHYDFIEQNKVEAHQDDGLTHCLLVLHDGCTDGVLVQCGDDGCAMYCSYVLEARNIVMAELDKAADFITRRCIENTDSGSWHAYFNRRPGIGGSSVSFEELEEQFGLTIRNGNGLDAMLVDALRRRPEVSDVQLVNGCVAATCRLDIQADLDVPEKQMSTPFSTERKVELFEKAVSILCEIFDHEDLYPMLHDSLGMTIQEIRAHGYMSDRELTETCQVPKQMLDCNMKVRDILRLDGISGSVCLTHADSDRTVLLEWLKELADSSLEEFAALLESQVIDIQLRHDDPELVLGGVGADEFERLCDVVEAHEQVGQGMRPMQ